MKEFKITLRAARVNRGLTLKDVAEKTGKCAETISKYEIDSTDIPRDLSLKLIEIYEVPQDLLFFGSESSLNGLSYSRKRKKQTA